MSIIGWFVIGGLAGWIASYLMKEPHGCVMNVIIGVIGAALGGFLFTLIGGQGFSGFNLWSLLVAVVGAVVLLAIVRAFRGQ